MVPKCVCLAPKTSIFLIGTEFNLEDRSPLRIEFTLWLTSPTLVTRELDLSDSRRGIPPFVIARPVKRHLGYVKSWENGMSRMTRFSHPVVVHV